MRNIIIGLLLLLSFGASAQWQQTGSKVRYVNGLGIPTKDTAAGVSADSSQILIRPADSSLYIKYKRTWVKVGSGGTIGGSGTTNYVPKFTTGTTLGNSQIFDNGTSVGIGTIPSSWRSGANAIQFGANGFGALWEQSSGSVDLAFAAYESATNTFAYKTTGDLPTLYQQVTGVHSWSNAPSGTAGNTITFNERMRISSGGNVLIGTPTDNGVDKLQVSGGMNVVGGNIVGGDGTVRTAISYAGTLGILGTLSNHNLGIYTNSLERMRITSGGNVGIGSYTSPAAKFVVDGTALINTNTDNGVDKLQVSGSAIANSYKTTVAIPVNTVSDAIILQNTTAATGVFPNVGFSPAIHFKGTGWPTPGSSSVPIDMRMYLASKSFNQASGRLVLDYSSNGSAYAEALVIDASTTANTTLLNLVAPGSGRTLETLGSSVLFGVLGGQHDIIFGDGNVAYFSFRTDPSATKMSIRNFSGGSDLLTVFRTSGNVVIANTTDNGVDKLQVNGSISGIGFKQAYVAKTGAYTATDADYVIDCTSGTFTVTLPASSGRTGRILIIKNSGAGTITVDGNASETIDGATTVTMAVQYGTIQIMSDGTNWKTIAKF